VSAEESWSYLRAALAGRAPRAPDERSAEG
jgi:hypothetical protein